MNEPARHLTSMISRRRTAQVVTAVALVAGMLVAAASAGRAASASVNCDAGGNLQAKIDAAASGSTVLVKGTCVGNFSITGKGLTLKGNPAATLDGNDVFRPLGINNTSSPGSTVHLIGLTVTGGVTQAPGGGGIIKIGGGLTLDRVTVTGNLATSSSSPVSGGGIFSGGNLTLTNSTISGNRARTTDSGGDALGGGLVVLGGKLSITNSTVTANRAAATLSSGDATARGGGFHIASGSFNLRGARVSGNRVSASGPGNSYAQGGGGFEGSSTAVNTVNGSVISGNAATAVAPSGFSGPGGGGLGGFGTLHVTGSTVSVNLVMGNGKAGSADAGGLTATVVRLTRSIVSGNRVAQAATGGNAGADGGGVLSEELEVTASTVSRNSATAVTSGAFASTAAGGGLNSDEMHVTNSTIALNRVKATSPGGGSSTAQGGGLLAQIGSTLLDSTVAKNVLTTSGAGTPTRQGGGVYTSGLSLEASILANNAGTTGPDCFGGPTSNGYNLIRNPAGCSFTKKGSDKVGVDPKLGLLRANGGPTQTMAIAATSPALNSIPGAACAVGKDQRGVHRPQGTRCDMGAYERKLP